MTYDSPSSSGNAFFLCIFKTLDQLKANTGNTSEPLLPVDWPKKAIYVTIGQSSRRLCHAQKKTYRHPDSNRHRRSYSRRRTPLERLNSPSRYTRRIVGPHLATVRKTDQQPAAEGVNGRHSEASSGILESVVERPSSTCWITLTRRRRRGDCRAETVGGSGGHGGLFFIQQHRHVGITVGPIGRRALNEDGRASERGSLANNNGEQSHTLFHPPLAPEDPPLSA